MKANKKTPDFAGKHNIYTLQDVPKGFLQVLLPGFVLTKEGPEEKSRLLEINLTDNLPAIVDKEGKSQFFQKVRKSSKGENKLRNDLRNFDQNQSLLSCRFDCSRHPLRYANGGVLPIIRWKDENDKVEEYFCFFYRDIFPIGWNIANGASDTIEELKNPELIMLREFGEELLIRDDKKNIVYSFNPGLEKDPGATPSKALKAWEKKHKKIVTYKTLSVPMTWIKGTDRVRVRSENETHESGSLFLNIVPDDNAIEVDRVALINVSGRINLFDGEQTKGIILNRAVGLFKIKNFKKPGFINSHKFIPDIIFYDGSPGNPDDLLNIVRKKINELREMPSPFRNSADQQEWESSDKKFDLCPITRLMVRSYFEKSVKPPSPKASDTPYRLKGDCEVFISYRSIDEAIAKGLHDHLESCGIKAFLSAISLPFLGESDYASAIDKALESSKCLVVIGTNPESFESGWVGYEWRSFLNEILSGRKKGCQIYTFISGISVEQLPFALRKYQMIPFTSSSPQDAFESLTRYLKQAMTRYHKNISL